MLLLCRAHTSQNPLWRCLSVTFDCFLLFLCVCVRVCDDECLMGCLSAETLCDEKQGAMRETSTQQCAWDTHPTLTCAVLKVIFKPHFIRVSKMKHVFYIHWVLFQVSLCLLCCNMTLKGIVHTKINDLSFTHRPDAPNRQEFLSSVGIFI